MCLPSEPALHREVVEKLATLFGRDTESRSKSLKQRVVEVMVVWRAVTSVYRLNCPSEVVSKPVLVSCPSAQNSYAGWDGCAFRKHKTRMRGSRPTPPNPLQLH